MKTFRYPVFLRKSLFFSSVTLCLAVLPGPPAAHAQELTPRAFWPAPKDTTTLVVAYAYQTGDVVTDPSLPIAGVDSDIHRGVVAWQKTLALLGRTSNLQLEVPFVRGSTRGSVDGMPADRNVEGLGDVAASLSFNLLGAPTMSAAEFQALRQKPRPILGASLRIVAPTGQYDADRLINIGANRWSVRARLGYIQPLTKRWLLESAIGVWFFRDNDDFLGTTREQDPIAAVDVSLIRRLRPGFWASLDATYYAGGRTTVGDSTGADLQQNARFGVAVVYPFKGRHAVKASYTLDVVTRSGGEFDAIGISYVRLLN